MKSAEFFDKEDFLRTLNALSLGINNADDLLKFAKYLKYRLTQKTAVDFFLSIKKGNLWPKDDEAETIYNLFEEAYENNPLKDQTFEEFLQRK